MAEGSNKEELGFESEVQQLLDLVINSLYRDKANLFGLMPIISAGFQSGITPKIVLLPSKLG